MMFIDDMTSREDLLNVIYSDNLLLDSFIEDDRDPELMQTDALRRYVIAWIETGDECQ